jgi:hypothetical protein
VRGRERQQDDPAHAVPDEDRLLGTDGVEDAEHVRAPDVGGVPRPVSAVAVAGQLQLDHPPVRLEQRRDVLPPQMVGAVPVHQDEVVTPLPRHGVAHVDTGHRHRRVQGKVRPRVGLRSQFVGLLHRHRVSPPVP